MRLQSPRKSLLAVLAAMALWNTVAQGQGTQLGSNSGSRGTRLAQYDGELIAEPDGMAGQGMVVQPGGDVWGDDACESQGWSNNVFGVPCGQSCQGRGAGFIAGGGVYYIKPMWTNNQGGVTTSPNAGGGTSITHIDINNDHEIAPFVFLGFVGPNGFGVRGRAWVYDFAANDLVIGPPFSGAYSSQSPLNTFFPIPVNTNVVGSPAAPLTITSNLQTYVYDLEAIQAIDHDKWTWTFSGGVRYSIIRQAYGVTRPAAGLVTGQTLTSLQRFAGWGPTVSLEGRRAFGQTGLALYGNARGSILFGGATQDVSQSGFTNNLVVPPVVVLGNDASYARWSVRPVLEFEIGGEYGYWLGTTARLFARAGLVGQAWLGAGNASNAGINGTADDNATLGFTGYRATFGVDY